MKQIRIFCIHPFCKDVVSFFNYMHLNYSDIEFIWDENSPEYLISTEAIYVNKKCNTLFHKLYLKAKINILVAQEAMCPDFNLFDYAVSFDCDLKNGDRFVQLMPPFTMFKDFLSTILNPIKNEYEALLELKAKSGFCNFLYSNWKAHPIRDELFFALSSYKKVDSLGRHLNNIGSRGTGYVGHANECSDIKRPYKFSIACENASFRGYTSEKIFTSLTAHTVPIYWGNPEIVKDVNSDCFINVNDYSSIDDMIQVVKKIDEDDSLWAKMVSSPWCTDSQIAYHKEREKNYKEFFYCIFNQNIEKASRVAKGAFPDKVRHCALSVTPVTTNKFLLLIDKFKVMQFDNILRDKYNR